MKVSEKNIEQIFEFEGLWGVDSKCGLKIVRKNNQSVIIVTELYKENPGTTITSIPASLAMQIASKFEISYQEMIYIESSPEMNSKLSFYDEEYFQVSFEEEDKKLKSPSWEKLTKEKLLEFIQK